MHASGDRFFSQRICGTKKTADFSPFLTLFLVDRHHQLGRPLKGWHLLAIDAQQKASGVWKAEETAGDTPAVLGLVADNRRDVTPAVTRMSQSNTALFAEGNNAAWCGVS